MSVDFNKIFVHQVTAFDEMQNYSVTIRVCSDGLSVFVTHQESLDYAASYQWPLLKDTTAIAPILLSIVSQDLYLKNNLPNICLLLDDVGYTLVPKSLFDAHEVDSYLSSALDKETRSNGVVIFSERNEVVVISQIQKSLLESVKLIFPHAKIHSYAAAFFNFKWGNNSSVFNATIAINSGSFDLKIEKRGQLIFFNKFAFSSKEDFVYFVVMALQGLEIDNAAVSIALLGKVEPNSPLTEMLNRYFLSVQFVKSSHEFAWDFHRYCVEQNYIL